MCVVSISVNVGLKLNHQINVNSVCVLQFGQTIPNLFID